MTVRNRGTQKKPRWYADFTIRGDRKRPSLPEARTKAEAVEAENALLRRVFEGTYGAAVAGSRLFSEFVDIDYMPWAKTNKRTWQNDERHALILKQAFTGKKLRDVSPLMIEKLKRELASQTTKFGTSRAPASVNLVLATGSGIFTLACDTDQASKNPFRKVKKLVVNNHQFRYLGWDEEPRLMEALVNPAVVPTRRSVYERVANRTRPIAERGRNSSELRQSGNGITSVAHKRVASAGLRSETRIGSIQQPESHEAMPLRASSQNLGRVEAVSLPEAAEIASLPLSPIPQFANKRVVGNGGRDSSRSATPVGLKAAQRAHLRDAIPVAIGTGLRRREQTTLRARQCDFARNVVIVEHSKSNRSREVPMNDDVRAILLRLCKGKRRDDYLFVNPKTKHPYRDFKKGFAAACAEAGIEGLSWKALRHTFGTRLGEAGHTAFDIADLMGHSDVRTSMRYVHATDRRKHEAVQSTMLSRRATA